MPIFDTHYQEWKNSGVCDQIIERNVWTIEDPRELDQLLNRNTGKKWKHSAHLVPGWAVAGVDLEGELTFSGAQFKSDNPRPAKDKAGNPKLDTDGNQKFVKYESPSGDPLSPLFLDNGQPDYWADLLVDLKRPILITEGAKKAGAALTYGWPCISVPGVTTGQKLGRLKPELEKFCKLGRRVYLAFDSDIIRKRQVQIALDQLGRLISAAGAVVSVVQLPEETKGLDDFVIADRDTAADRLQALITDAPTLEEWRAEWKDSPMEEVEEVPCVLARRFKAVQAKIGKHLRFNELKNEIELLGEVVDMDELQLTLALQFNIQMPESDCIKIVTALARRQKYHPVAEYLEQMADTLPPDSDLLNQLAPKYFGTDDPLHVAYIRKTLIAAVARALSPGCKVDSVLILQGLQGIGKSGWFQRLMPNPEWFDDSLGAASDKDERLKLHQAWFLEWGELERLFRKRDVSQMKAFITTQVDYLRPPYGRTVKAYYRRSILVGSTNDDEFLSDATGNRRFWIVPVTQAVPLAKLDEERHRIWAAAVHAYRSGERWQLPAELRERAATETSSFELSDPWGRAVMQYAELQDQVQVEDILIHALKIDLPNQDRVAQMRVSAILKREGWISRRGWINGKRPRIWVNPKSLNLDGQDGSVGSQTPKAPNSNRSVVIQPLIQPPKNRPLEVGSNGQILAQRSNDPSDPSDPSKNQTFERKDLNGAIPPWYQPGVTVTKIGKRGWRGTVTGIEGKSPVVHWQGDPSPVLSRWEDLAPVVKEVQHG